MRSPLLRLLLGSILAATVCPATDADAVGVSLALGHPTVALDGPWKFHVGDDLSWADPGFDDSAWESIDLTPPPGAHDNDVGLKGYVPGWSARGHRGYSGYAWYRIHLTLNPAPSGQPLALSGPFVVDDAFQVYLDGRLLGGRGNFTTTPPTAYSNHMPTLVSLPAELAGGPAVLAVRVWMGNWNAGAPDGGGMHIAPVLGWKDAATAHYRTEWLEVFEGYIVDAVEALVFVLLALMALSLRSFDRRDAAYVWLAAALLLTAVHRGNQPFFFWTQWETVHAFELVTITLAIPLYVGCWVMAWRAWLRVDRPAWLPGVAGGLTLIYVLAQFLSRSWFRGTVPAGLRTLLHDAILTARLALLALLIAIVWQGLRRARREALYALPALVAVSIGVFAPELSLLHVPGIWFPFGVGVSRTEYAYAVFDLLLFALLLQRLRALARR